MHNDRLQGILFDQSQILDLSFRSRRNRFMRKVAVARQGLLNRNPQTGPMRSTGPYAIAKSVNGKQYTSAIDELQRRFKPHELDS